mmetsp:Transcript_21262/g.44647  ORF Transcript_21262/g.44647 Transcript_21262/m.44647 type:complete len:204 (-) Transcript_21262:485-1096(-)
MAKGRRQGTGIHRQGTAPRQASVLRQAIGRLRAKGHQAKVHRQAKARLRAKVHRLKGLLLARDHRQARDPRFRRDSRTAFQGLLLEILVDPELPMGLGIRKMVRRQRRRAAIRQRRTGRSKGTGCRRNRRRRRLARHRCIWCMTTRSSAWRRNELSFHGTSTTIVGFSASRNSNHGSGRWAACWECDHAHEPGSFQRIAGLGR